MPNIFEKQLEEIDWNKQFFKREHFLAFLPAKWPSPSDTCNQERIEVGDRLFELHTRVYPMFKDYGLMEIHKHNMDEHVTSSAIHIDGFTSKNLSSMWLHYGKSPRAVRKYTHQFYNGNKQKDERNLQSFINHARLQVIIRMEENLPRVFETGVWLVFGKDNDGSFYDRKHFKEQMLFQEYRENFFSLVNALPEDYWISINNPGIPVHSFLNADVLSEYVEKDNGRKYFIIGRTYKPGATEMDDVNINETVLQEFKNLYPLYTFMRDKKFD